MAHSRIENTRVIHLILNEEEALYLRELTKDDEHNTATEESIRLNIWEELNKALNT